MLELFENHNAGPLGEHEAVSVGIERTARPLRIVSPEREGAHVLEAGQPHGRQRRLAPPRQHHVGIAALNRPESAAD